MKVAVIYNKSEIQDSDVINVFGMRTKEWYSSEIVELVNSLHLHNNRIEALIDQLYGINRRIMQIDSAIVKLADQARINRKEFVDEYRGHELDPNWMERMAQKSGRGWQMFIERSLDKAEELHREVLETHDRETAVLVEEGQAVAKGDGLLIIESMKMEIDLPAPVTGTVSQLLVEEGGRVTAGEPVLVMEELQ